MQFHTVETGVDGAAGRVGIGLGVRGDLGGVQGAWYRSGDTAGGHEDIADRGYGRRADRLQAGGVGMGDPSAVHDLREDPSAVGVHSGGHRTPGVDVFVGVQPGCPRIGLTDRVRLYPFAHDQTGSRPLRVVGRHRGCGQTTGGGPHPGHGSHHHAVGQRRITESVVVEKAGHLRSPSSSVYPVRAYRLP